MQNKENVYSTTFLQSRNHDGIFWPSLAIVGASLALGVFFPIALIGIAVGALGIGKSILQDKSLGSESPVLYASATQEYRVTQESEQNVAVEHHKELAQHDQEVVDNRSTQAQLMNERDHYKERYRELEDAHRKEIARKNDAISKAKRESQVVYQTVQVPPSERTPIHKSDSSTQTTDDAVLISSPISRTNGIVGNDSTRGSVYEPTTFKGTDAMKAAVNRGPQRLRLGPDSAFNLSDSDNSETTYPSSGDEGYYSDSDNSKTTYPSSGDEWYESVNIRAKSRSTKQQPNGISASGSEAVGEKQVSLNSPNGKEVASTSASPVEVAIPVQTSAFIRDNTSAESLSSVQGDGSLASPDRVVSPTPVPTPVPTPLGLSEVIFSGGESDASKEAVESSDSEVGSSSVNPSRSVSPEVVSSVSSDKSVGSQGFEEVDGNDKLTASIPSALRSASAPTVSNSDTGALVFPESGTSEESVRSSRPFRVEDIDRMRDTLKVIPQYLSLFPHGLAPNTAQSSDDLDGEVSIRVVKPQPRGVSDASKEAVESSDSDVEECEIVRDKSVQGQKLHGSVDTPGSEESKEVDGELHLGNADFSARESANSELNDVISNSDLEDKGSVKSLSRDNQEAKTTPMTMRVVRAKDFLKKFRTASDVLRFSSVAQGRGVSNQSGFGESKEEGNITEGQLDLSSDCFGVSGYANDDSPMKRSGGLKTVGEESNADVYPDEKGSKQLTLSKTKPKTIPPHPYKVVVDAFLESMEVQYPKGSKSFRKLNDEGKVFEKMKNELLPEFIQKSLDKNQLNEKEESDYQGLKRKLETIGCKDVRERLLGWCRQNDICTTKVVDKRVNLALSAYDKPPTGALQSIPVQSAGSTTYEEKIMAERTSQQVGCTLGDIIDSRKLPSAYCSRG